MKNCTFIIAEAGVNHNGSMRLAKQLVDVAAEAGADAIKFQTFTAESLVLKDTEKADYQKQNGNELESQFEMIKKLELDLSAHHELIAYCKEKKIMFLSTPFDHESISMLSRLGIKTFKIPSGEITNLPYLRHIGSVAHEVILSTGMSYLSEVQEALKVLVESGTAKECITVLHANSMYPTPMADVNLNAMLTIKNECGVNVGYSDHTLGIEVDIAAVALGANVIEKHFTLDNSMEGPDHKASLEPHELRAMVLAIRNIETALGTAIKQPSPSEAVNTYVARKSIVASQDINKGDKLSSKNLTTKRPGTGICPMKWDQILGNVANKNYQKDDLI